MQDTEQQSSEMQQEVENVEVVKPVKRRQVLKMSLLMGLGLGFAGAGTLYYTKKIEPSWVDTTYLQFRLPRLTPAFHGYRLVQISDIHADVGFMSAGRVADLVNTINGLHADLVVITGDSVTYHSPQFIDVLSELRYLKVKDGTLAVLGNHDHSSGATWVRTCLDAGHVNDISGSFHTIKRGDEMLHIVGMDDLWPRNYGTPDYIWNHLPVLESLTSQIPSQGAAVLLVHEPDFADVAAHVGRYDLELSGHSHGGQVRLPLIGALELPPLARRYPIGLYQVSKMMHYTNRGLGMVSPRVRFNCRPEITVFELSAH
jgi:predicted MPP superfamily phosphohydrolase